MNLSYDKKTWKNVTWSTQESEQNLTVTQPGYYKFTAETKDGCIAESERLWVIIDAEIWIDPLYQCVIDIFQSGDPNDIIGPAGYGERRWITKNDKMPYRILFENDPEIANAPVKYAYISQKLDSTLDFKTFRLGGFGFAGFTFDVPENTSYYYERIDVKDSLGVYVDVTAGLDVTTGTIFWVFQAVDTASGHPVKGVLEGFLPVNDSVSHAGEAYVDYTIKPKDNAITGDIAHARATIVFDENEPVDTRTIFNTIDAVGPVSRLDSLPEYIDSTHVLLSWRGSDDSTGSGVGSYTIFMSENGEPFREWLSNTRDTTVYFNGTKGNWYRFYSIARDNAGNLENAKSDWEVEFALAGPTYAPVALPAVNVADTCFTAHWEPVSIAQSYRLDVAYDRDFNNYVSGYQDLPVGDTSKTVTWLDGDTTYYYRVRALNPAGPSENSNIIRVQTRNRIYASIKVFMEGPFDVDSMRTDLRQYGYIPLKNPYSGSPWNYTGGDSVSHIPSGVVDWMLVELRSGTGDSTKVSERAAFVKSDGAVVDTNGTDPLSFWDVEEGDYYIVMHHRNHISIMSDSAKHMSGVKPAGYTHDFTTGQGQAYGSDAMKQLATGIFGMFGGDVVPDGYINYATETSKVWNDKDQLGYYSSDINADGYVNYSTESSIIWNNRDTFTQVP